MSGWREQPLLVRLSLIVALLGLLGTALFVYELPALLSVKYLELQCDSLERVATGLRNLELELAQLREREQRLRALMADQMHLTVDTLAEAGEVGRLLIRDALPPDMAGQVPIVNPVRGVVSREFVDDLPPLHPGVDIAGEEGDPVVATANGTVVYASWSPAYGNLIILVHRNGFVTRYGHLKTLLVKEGETVFQNQAIGELGTTGFSSAPHLHYEIWQGRRRLDPWQFLDF